MICLTVYWGIPHIAGPQRENTHLVMVAPWGRVNNNRGDIMLTTRGEVEAALAEFVTYTDKKTARNKDKDVIVYYKDGANEVGFYEEW